MKKQLACLFLCIQLAGNTEAGQVFRLPMLLKHFHEHQLTRPRITLAEFLAMHYAGEGASRTEHKDLPFHDMMHSSVAFIYAPMTSPAVTAVLPPPPPDLSGPNYTEKLSSIYFDRIPRPPEC